MSLTRRRFVQSAALISTLPTPLIAETMLGDAKVTTVSDGHLVLPGSFVFPPDPSAELLQILNDAKVSATQLTPECNLTLYQSGARKVLFDVGAGPDFMPTAGKLTDSLAAAGVTPDDITDVIFTHAHPDHIWGLLDEFDDPLFPDAAYHMGRAEWDYWWDPETVNTIGSDRAAFAVGAKRRMEVIEDQVQFFEGGDEILTGITAVSTPGHTPGHMGFALQHGADTAMVVGDAIGNHHVAFARPDWVSPADQEGDLAAKTRIALLDQLTTDQALLIGFHLPGGGMGRAEKTADGYRFVTKDM